MPSPSADPATVRAAASAVIFRGVLIFRMIVMVAAVVLSLTARQNLVPSVLALLVMAVVSACSMRLINWKPGTLPGRAAIITLDTTAVLALLVITHGSIVYFCAAAGASAAAGALLGTTGLPLWVAHAVLGLVVCIQILGGVSPDDRLALEPFLLAQPVTNVLWGITGAACTAGLRHYLTCSIETANAVQQMTAASERTRLARELHDSVAKTLRGVSFAAIALPTSLRRHPDLAEQLAGTVSAGATTAVRETRELMAGLRRDAPEQPFAQTVSALCDSWSTSAGIPVQVRLGPLEPSLAARYELAQILHEALRNIADHAGATRVEVAVVQHASSVLLTVDDDGRGFVLPADFSTFPTAGHFGVVGMTERARAIGGTLTLSSAPGHGTSISVEVPLTDAAREKYLAES